MATLTREEIRTHAKNAGFTGKNLDIAVAVALAESEGNPRAYNGKNLDRSYGLWQINMLGDMGPDRRKRFHLKSNDDLFDPATNARVAYGIWKESGWSPWTTYTRGDYKEHMTSTSGDAPSSEDVAREPVLGIGASINAFGETLLKSFASIGAVAVALVLLVLGVIILLRNPVASLASRSVVGKVATTAKKVSA